MTPAARVAAAIEVLDGIFGGATPEKALTGWGRSHRFAGSKDRAAIRDHVFQALRCKLSYGWLGGLNTGRGVMLGAMRQAGSVDTIFTSEGYAPPSVEDHESGQPLDQAPRHIRCDMPEWLLPHFDTAFEDDADDVMQQLRGRASVFLRVNTARTTREDAAAQLMSDGIATKPVEHVKTALQVTENERRIASSAPYLSGLVELQDTSSQQAIASLPLKDNMRVLDYCAGGGGKSLALAARGAQVTAHDIDPARMIDLGLRADRAKVEISTALTSQLHKLDPFDLVLCDAPCSGSGTWRRTPAAKWNLTAERLSELTKVQDDVLVKASALVGLGGTLAYATCSVFEIENMLRIQGFADRNSWTIDDVHLLRPTEFQDGFFLAILKRSD